MATKSIKKQKLTAEQKKALKAVKDSQKEAKEDYESYPKLSSFECEGEVTDKNGEATKVLLVQTDRKGMIGFYLDNGNPLEFNPKSGEVNTDKALLRQYVNFMSNIDLEDEDNLEAIGIGATAKAREFVSNFFMLRLVLDMSVERETGE